MEVAFLENVYIKDIFIYIYNLSVKIRIHILEQMFFSDKHSNNIFWFIKNAKNIVTKKAFQMINLSLCEFI